MKLYRDVLQHAWHHAIQRPGLWIFGFFATLVFGSSGELDRYLRFMNGIVSDGDVLNPKSWLDGRWLSVARSFYDAMAAGQVTAWLFSGALLLAGLVVMAMVSLSVGALIHSAAHKTDTFAEAFTAGAKHWVQLVVLFVAGYLVVVIATLAMVTAVLAVSPANNFQATQLLLTIVAGVVFIPLVIVVSLLLRLTAMAVVLDQAHIGSAWLSAWRLFTRHWLPVLEMAIVSFVVVGVISLALLLGLTIIFLPFFVSLSFGTAAHALLRLQDTLFVGQWVYLGVSFFSAAILSTWQWSAWTLLFQALRTDTHSSTLVRWIREVQ